MHTHWSQFVPNNYVSPTSEDIKFHIIIIIIIVVAGESLQMQKTDPDRQQDLGFLVFDCFRYFPVIRCQKLSEPTTRRRQLKVEAKLLDTFLFLSPFSSWNIDLVLSLI